MTDLGNQRVIDDAQNDLCFRNVRPQRRLLRGQGREGLE